MSRARFYAGLFLLTLATLMLEVIQTRLLSVVTWYHLAFFVISSAMFGMTAGAVWVYLNRGRFTPDSLADDLSRGAAAFALSTGLTLAFQVTLAPNILLSAGMVLAFVELTLAMAIPFFFSGIVVSLALTRSPYPVGVVYAVDLAGAALGCLGVLVILQWTDAPSAILLVGAMAAAAAVLFRRPAAESKSGSARLLSRILSRPRALFATLLIAGLLNGTTTRGLQPVVVKEAVEKRGADVLYVKWNCFSRVIAFAQKSGIPALWGPSPRLPIDTKVEQISMNIDGCAGTTMFRYNGDPRTVGFLAYDVTNLAYTIRHTGRVAIIGVGSGRDVLSAWTFGARDITGVELNPIFVDLLRRQPPFVEFAGVAALPGVRLVADEARSWFSRTPQSFDLIQMSMIDTWAATGAGAFSLSENGLYTVEAWKTFLGHLTPRGILTVSRWYAPSEVNETGRMISLAVAAMLELGVTDPRSHIFLASVGNVATTIVSKAPLAPGEIAALRAECARLGYDILASPGSDPASRTLADITGARTRDELERRTSHLDLDLTPPTDDRPFFFNLLPLGRAHHALKYMRQTAGVVGGNIIATISLLTILLVSITLVVVTIVLPLRPALREVGRDLVVGGTAYFGFLGLGFMLVEIGLLQRLGVFLGHPVYSLSVVLFSLILTTGFGSMLSERLRLGTPKRIVLWAVGTALYLILLPVWMPSALRMVEASGIAARAGLSAALIAPAGLLMGFGFPTGMQLVSSRDARPTPWFWGVNGAAGVLASVLAVAININFGIHLTLILGAACYLALIPSMMVIRHGSAASRATA